MSWDELALCCRGPVVLRVLRGLLGPEAWQGLQAVLEQQARRAALARVGRVARRGRLVLQGSMDLSEQQALKAPSVLSARREMSVQPALEELKATKALLETLAGDQSTHPINLVKSGR